MEHKNERSDIGMNRKIMSKYEFIKHQILSDIAEGIYHPGDKIPSESELCKKFRTSRITVRKALDELVASGVLEKLQGVGAFIKEQKNNGSSKNTVIVVIPYVLTLLSREIWTEMLHGIEDVFTKENILFFEMMGPNSLFEQERFLETLQELSPMGIIYLFYYGLDVQKELVKLNCPVVFVDMEPENNMFDLVKGDDYQSAYNATCLMLESGKKNIGFFGNMSKEFSTLREREKGIRDAIGDFGGNLQESLFYYPSNNLKSNGNLNPPLHMDGVEEGIRYLKKNWGRLDALITYNDACAGAILVASGSLGIRIPEELAIISYGNYYIPRKHYLYENMNCSITSHEQSFYEYGRIAADLVVKRARGEVPLVQQKRIISYQLVRKASF